MNSVDQIIRRMMLAYPGLYHSRLKALCELFGNSGYDWRGGEMVDVSGSLREPEPVFDETDEGFETWRFQHKWLHKVPVPEMSAHQREMAWESFIDNNAEKLFTYQHIDGMVNGTVIAPNKINQKYPLQADTHSTRLMNFPDDIKPEWLAAIVETARALKAQRIEDFQEDVVVDGVRVPPAKLLAVRAMLKAILDLQGIPEKALLVPIVDDRRHDYIREGHKVAASVAELFKEMFGIEV